MAKRKPKLKPTGETPVAVEVVNAAPAEAVPANNAPEPESVSLSAPVETSSSTPLVTESSPPPAATPVSSAAHASRVAAGPTMPNPFPFREDVEAGIQLAEDRRFKQMQIAFLDKPSDAVRYEIGDAGYRWQSKERVWSKQLDPQQAWQTRAEADALFETIAAMIREEKGLGQHR